jgi:hypothetical protein
MKRTVAFMFLVAALAAGGVSQAADPVLPLPPQDRKRIDAQLGAGVVGQALPSKPIGPASEYFPLHDKALSYQVVTGSHPGRVETLGVAQLKRPGGKPSWRFQFTPTLAGFLKPVPAGGLAMPSVADSSEGVLVVSTPANPFVPTGMKPGETRSYQQNVSVKYLDDPSDQRFSGTVNGTCTYVGTYKVTVPAGTFDAVLLRLKFSGKVGPVQTSDTQYNLFAPGVGLIAMITQENVAAFWLFHIDSTTGKVLITK